MNKIQLDQWTFAGPGWLNENIAESGVKTPKK